MYSFNEELAKCKNNMITIKLSHLDLYRIDVFVRNLIKEKVSETHHQCDNGMEYKRFFTGIMGERAIELLFGKRFIKWEVGDSKDYNFADLQSLGVNVGIKTVELNKFPIIHKEPTRPEIVAVRLNEDTIIVCGLATIDVLKSYQNDDLVLSSKLRSRGTKTGFYGFGHLYKVSCLDDLKRLTA